MELSKDETIRMAREAGFNESGCAGIIGVEDFLERFAALVAAHEREKPVTVPANGLRQQEPSRSSPTGSQSNEIVPVGYVDAMFRFQTCQEHHVSPSDRFKPVYTAEQIEAAVLAEREACAKVADGELMNTNMLTSYPPKSSAAWNIAAAIRARS